MNSRISSLHLVLLAAASPALAASTFSAGVSQGTINSLQINEASGLAASRNNANVLWTHNDSGDTHRIFAIDTTGKLLGTYTLSGATHRDWEAIAVGPGPVDGVNYLYLMESNEGADPGRVYRVPEPVVYAVPQALTPVSATLVGVESKKFSFAEADTESMFVDPVDGGIYLGSKESGRVDFYHGTQAQFATAGTTTLASPAASIAGIISNANGADISPDGRQVLVRFNGSFALLYDRTPGQTVAQALAGAPQGVPVNGQDIEVNAEAIAFDSVGRDYFTLSEGVNQKLYRYARTSDDAPFQPVTLLAAGSEWKYLDDGSDQGTAWRNSGFDDSTWATGAGQFGYGDTDEATTVSFGGNPSDKHPTTYFRTTFTVADVSEIDGLTLKLLYDDGAAVYLNGTEIARENLVAAATFDMLADGLTPDALENTWFSVAVDPGLLVSGLNTLSVEIHQGSPGDADLSFDAQLVTAVPEPAAGASIVLALCGVANTVARRRRK